MRSTEKILIFSDIHLTSGGKEIIGLDPLGRLKLALHDALYNHPDAQHIVFTGDLAHDGDFNAYQSLRKVIQGIKIPITFMMGNHDNRTIFSQVFPSVVFDINNFLQSSSSIDSYELLFLDTLQAPAILSEKHEGFLCEKRLGWLDKKLENSKQKKVVIFMHHPPFPVGFKARDPNGLHNSKNFFSILKKYHHVIHIISGHIHRTISGHINGFGFSIFKSTCHQMPMQLDSENVKLSIVEPGAYGLLLLQPDGLVVHSVDFGLQDEAKKLFDGYD